MNYVWLIMRERYDVVSVYSVHSDHDFAEKLCSGLNSLAHMDEDNNVEYYVQGWLVEEGTVKDEEVVTHD